MPRLSTWLERTHHLDRLELELEWARISPADIFDELAEIVTAGDQAALAGLQAEMEQPRLRRLFEFFHRQAGGQSPVETHRLLDTARGMVAAAGALLAELQGGESADAQTHSTFAQAAEIWPAAGWWVAALRAHVAGEPTLIGAESAETRSIRLPELRAGAAGTESAGTLGSLSVLRIPGGSGLLFPHPLLQGLTPATREFAETVSLAWTEALALIPTAQEEEALSHDYTWWLQSGASTEATGAVLAGGSHGAALTTVLALALQGRPADPDFTLTGAILPGGAVGEVAGVREKARYALGVRGAFGRFELAGIYVPEANLEQARQAAFECGRNPDECVRVAPRIVELLDDATGLPAQIARLCASELQEILELASTRMRRRVKSCAELKSLRVPILVENVAAAAEESGSRPGDALTWKEAFRALRRCLVLGEPGGGKSSLLWTEVGEGCEGFLKAREVGESGKSKRAERAFGVFLPAVSLAGLAWEENPEGCADVLARHVVGRRAVKPALRRATEQEMARQIRSGELLVAIDALDEVDRQRLGALTRALRRLAELPDAQLLMSVRLGSYEETAGLVAPAEELLIRPFDAQQVHGAIRAWFADDPARADRLLQSLGVEMDALLETPQLVWMLCWLARETQMGDGTEGATFRRRADIFEAFLAECVERWRHMTPPPDSFQAGLMLPFAGDVALALLQVPNAGEGFDEAAARAAIEGAAPVYRSLSSRDTLQDLLSCGFLTRAHGSARGPGALNFANTVVAEYLAGRSLARAARLRGWDAVEEWVDEHAGSPQWHEVIVFLAACMDEPAPLFELLTDPRRDDESRTRLALAAMCLPDVVRREEPSTVGGQPVGSSAVVAGRPAAPERPVR